MAFRMGRMMVMRSLNYRKFVEVMKGKIDKHGGHLARIAKDIGVGDSTVKRWLLENSVLHTHTKRARVRRRVV